MKKAVSQKEMIEKTLEKIKRLFPKTRSVTVNLHQDKHGLFHSKIEIKTTARKTFVVQKVGKTMQEGLKKAQTAMVNKMRSFKSSRFKSHYTFSYPV